MVAKSVAIVPQAVTVAKSVSAQTVAVSEAVATGRERVDSRERRSRVGGDLGDGRNGVDSGHSRGRVDGGVAGDRGGHGVLAAVAAHARHVGHGCSVVDSSDGWGHDPAVHGGSMVSCHRCAVAV
ncbi:unnamed protein product [Ixodes persulcatus]